MAIFKCKMCGGTIEINNNETVATCDYCGVQQTLPKLDDEKRANLYDRANHFRRNNEFDKAMGIYEQILNEDKTDAEGYWSLVLCRYGIEYVEDPASHKRVPTVNRAQFTSIFDDADYKSALEYADTLQKTIYEDEAKAINEIQKGILAISQKEEPFDVFICYKESDNNGRRTPDSVLANDLYHQLTQEGFKVFFSRITLEDKLGSAYEPYIFAALNSAKVMVVLGTKPEYFNAVWVKNEWSRYLSLVKASNGQKILIPAYKDMDPYDLPEEFSHLQAQDMSKLGFMQDLIRGIKKIAQDNEPKATVVKETVVTGGNANVDSILKRVSIFLEDGDFESADEYCEKALDIDPECAEAYLGKLMVDLRVKTRAELSDCEQPFDDNTNYKKAIRFGDAKLKEELKGIVVYINERIETAHKDGIYNEAKNIMQITSSESEYKCAANLFDSIIDYKDSSSLKEECLEKAETARLERERKEEEERKAAEARAKKKKKLAMIITPIVAVVLVFVIVLTTVIIPNGKYNDAVALMENKKYMNALVAFSELGDFKDSKSYYSYIMNEIAVKETISAGSYHTVGLKSNGTVVAVGDNKYGQCDVSGWTDIVAVSAGSYHTVGLKSDGTVVAVGLNDYGQCDVSGWTDIVAISAVGGHTVGLKSYGTVVAVGRNDYGQCDVSGWTDIVAVSAGSYHTVGLKSDGTVVAVGSNTEGQCDVEDWTDIVAISAGDSYTIGLKSNGTVIAVGDNDYGQCGVSGWTDIVEVSTGAWHTVGLKPDGTVIAVGGNYYGQCDVSGWTDIVAISAVWGHTVGLKSDGTVVVIGANYRGECDVSGWTNIKLPEKK